MRLSKVCATAGALGPFLLASSPAFADDDVDEMLEETVQDLILGEAVFTQERLELQPVAGGRYLNAEGAELVTLSVGAELGLTDRLQLELSQSYEIASDVDTASGLASLELGVLYALYSSRATGLGVTAGAGAETPSFSDEIGEDNWSYGPVLVGYKTLGPLALNVTLGVELEREDGEMEPTYLGVASLLFPTPNITPLLEIGVEAGEETIWSGALGAAIRPAPSFELAAAFLDVELPETRAIGGELLVIMEIELAGEPDEAREARTSRAPISFAQRGFARPTAR